MAEPQPRKYLTRARAKAEANPTDGGQQMQGGRTRTSEKRKALAETTASTNEVESSTRALRASRRTVRTVPTVEDPAPEVARGVRAAPKRKATKTATMKKSTTVAAARGPKKVAFVATPQALLADKENLIPVQKDAPVDTDELMSSSMGALSVKPLRVPSTKLPLPTVTPSTLFDPIPALSPSKARRIPVKSAGLTPRDEEMEDELSSPRYSKLAAKPKRIGGAAAKRTNAEANENKPLDISASLISSPARRPPASPFRFPTPNNHTSRPTEESGLLSSVLASPARRPPGLIPGFGASPVKGNFRLEPLPAPGAMDPSPSKPGLQSLPKRVKVTDHVKAAEPEVEQDELGMDIDTNLLGRKSPPAVRTRVLDSSNSEESSVSNRTDAAGLFDEIMSPTKPKGLDQMFREIESDRKLVVSLATTPNCSAEPPAPPSEKSFGFTSTGPEHNNTIAISPSPLPDSATLLEEMHAGLPGMGADFEGDITMEDTEDNTETILKNAQSLSPTPRAPPSKKKHKSPSEGGSSYGFFDSDGDSDDGTTDDKAVPSLAPGDPSCCPIVRGLSSMDLTIQAESERRTLFPNAPAASDEELGHDIDWSHTPKFNAISSCTDNIYGIPIDPALLLTQAEFLGIVEEHLRKTTIPVKLPPEEDSSDDDVEIEDQENTRPSPGSSSTVVRAASPTVRNAPPASNDYARRRSSMVNQMGVLAGAVVYVDAHTAGGADASGPYEETLRALGARVLRSWNWNPDGGNKDKVGITHVVFKDGSPRTLRKVKDSKGVVVCVGVGWVLQCQAEQEWVDESRFAVDLDMMPRGGHRRRKSMEPKALSALSDPKTPQVAKVNSFSLSSRLVPQTEPKNALLAKNLLIARRKSMQFMPKIGSPLAKNSLSVEY